MIMGCALCRLETERVLSLIEDLQSNNTVYPALLPLMPHTSAGQQPTELTPRPPADLNGLVRFARKTKSGFCACAVTFQKQYTSSAYPEAEVTYGSRFAHTIYILYNLLPRHMYICPKRTVILYQLKIIEANKNKTFCPIMN